MPVGYPEIASVVLILIVTEVPSYVEPRSVLNKISKTAVAVT